MTSVAASSSPTWRGGRRLWQSVVLAVALLTGALAAPAGAQGGAPRTVRVWEIPHDTPLYPGTQLSTGAPGLARGPDGNIWFSQIFPNEGQFPSRVGRISPNGVFQRPYSTGNDLVEFMTPGPDGNVWFAEHFGAAGGASVGRITSSGRLTRFPTCGLPSCSLGDLAVGADGNLWVPSGNGLIYRVTPGGQVTGFPVPLPAARPIAITAGPDGNMWFTDSGRDEIGRITPDGVVTEFPLIHPKGIPVPHGVLQLLHITSFAGDLWVDAGSPGYGFNGSIGRIDTHGRLVATYLRGYSPTDLNVGPDGVYAVVVKQFTLGIKIARISAGGTVILVPAPLQYGGTIIEGPDNNMWFEGSTYEATTNTTRFFMGRLTTSS